MLHFFAERPCDFDEFRRSIVQMRKFHRFNARLSRLPFLWRFVEQTRPLDSEAEAKHLLGIIDSMTPEERKRPHLIDIPRRRRRVAVGAGVDQAEVLRVVEQFDAMAGYVGEFARTGIVDRVRLLLIEIRHEMSLLCRKTIN